MCLERCECILTVEEACAIMSLSVLFAGDFYRTGRFQKWWSAKIRCWKIESGEISEDISLSSQEVGYSYCKMTYVPK